VCPLPARVVNKRTCANQYIHVACVNVLVLTHTTASHDAYRSHSRPPASYDDHHHHNETITCRHRFGVPTRLRRLRFCIVSNATVLFVFFSFPRPLLHHPDTRVLNTLSPFYPVAEHYHSPPPPPHVPPPPPAPLRHHPRTSAATTLSLRHRTSAATPTPFSHHTTTVLHHTHTTPLHRHTHTSSDRRHTHTSSVLHHTHTSSVLHHTHTSSVRRHTHTVPSAAAAAAAGV
jgi:hypothetical protein